MYINTHTFLYIYTYKYIYMYVYALMSQPLIPPHPVFHSSALSPPPLLIGLINMLALK